MAFGAAVRKFVGILAVAAIVAAMPVHAADKEKELPPAPFVPESGPPGADYTIGPLDALTVFVWRNPELGAQVQVRPDGRITLPLISDMVAVGKTPSKLSDDIRDALSTYITDPIVSVIVNNFSGTFSQQIRIVGAAEKPASVSYRSDMTLLDAMIAVGGLSQFAAGNRAKLIRYDPATKRQQEFRLRIDSLLKRGDIKANVKLQPGDVIIIPESVF
ncbi:MULTISPECIES: XrtA/PEP-CTERM system exopolysaccharide export protein [unclassified Sphingomonas]|uniref:XrtA/PEP-CTERM system exopolysaccharide export protein n=1 Tax=unclassified Sphingomonas TaxID=196159 RepID=UPI0006F51376|nr:MULTISPECIES: XrtA/PEP-CTERM system exopolysaccharide export protein [unclassified Sphingomonas]KQX22726.1 polysaccharide export protein [Sphingomonas sp. Root1294]KQY67794.1 polysaccharide export protein [Sphingomonas sp. Root50]KRB88873.1 polysaccharide export protein [Sphingomonas sp. Root720]